MNALKLIAIRARQLRAAGHFDAQSEAEVPSPCISVCCMEPDTGLCQGCLRTIEEITAWSRLPAVGKRAVWQAIATRAA